MNMIIYGAGSGGRLFLHTLQMFHFHISAFIDSNTKLHTSTIEGIPVFPPERLQTLNYDYLIIASSYAFEKEIYLSLKQLGVPKYKILFGSHLRYSAQSRLAAFDQDKDISTCVSGISYHKNALVNEFSEHSIFNYALPSQDIYYDHKIACELIKNRRSALQNWIIGLSYYSLHYDMSLSKTWENVSYYSGIFGFHNLSEARMQRIADLMPQHHPNNLFPHSFFKALDTNEYNFSKAHFGKTVDAVTLAQEAKERAPVDFNKNYPDTVTENTGILHNYIRFLIDNAIRPIIVVAPAPLDYRQFIDLNIAHEFLTLMESLQREYGIAFIDGFTLHGYDHTHFMDHSHLNIRGSKKFTRHIDDVLSRLSHSPDCSFLKRQRSSE